MRKRIHSVTPALAGMVPPPAGSRPHICNDAGETPALPGAPSVLSPQSFVGRVAVVLATIALLAVGCGGGPKTNVAVERARDAYLEAEANPSIAANAPVELHEARKALDRAETAEDPEDQSHLAYLAERKVQTAVATAEAKRAEQRMESLTGENQEMLLETRKQEAEAARDEALRMKAEAEARAREVELARERAEKLQQEAEARAREAEAARQQAAKAKAEAQRLSRELSELSAQQTERGLLMTLGDVLFDTGKAELKAGARRGIVTLADFLREHPNRGVLIEGHTDSVGNAEYNLSLSRRRAEAVKRALVGRGVSAARIIAGGYGEEYPVADNTLEAGRQQNRRVEIIILDEGVRPESMVR